MKTFKFEVTLSEEDVNGDEFYEECLEQPDGGVQMIRQAVEDALVFNNLIVDSDPKEAVKVYKWTPDSTDEKIKTILLASGKVAIAAKNVINSNAKSLSWNVSELDDKLDKYNKLIFEYSK